MTIGFLNMEPLLNASLAIQLHVLFALISFVVSTMILWRKKGGSSHKKWGKFLVLTMGLTAISSFFIFELRTFGLFSPIHIISIITLVSLYLAIKYIRAGNVKAHKLTMRTLYVGGMLVAGGLTFIPGQLMHKVAVDPVELYLGAFNQRAFTSISIATWLVPVMVTILVVIILNRKAIMKRVRSR